MFVSEHANQWKHPWLAGLGMGLQWMAIAVMLADGFGAERASVPVRVVAIAGVLIGGACMVAGMRKRTPPALGAPPRADAASR